MNHYIATLRTVPGAPVITVNGYASSEANLKKSLKHTWPDGELIGYMAGTPEFLKYMAPLTPDKDARRLIPELVAGLYEASAALPDAWFAVKCDVPREVIDKLDLLRRRARKLNFEAAPPPSILDRKKIQVVGSEGSFHICPYTGMVVSPRESVPQAYRDIREIDLIAYSVWATNNGIVPTSEIDLRPLRTCDMHGQWKDPSDADWMAYLDQLKQDDPTLGKF